jgi:hypothetical protein
LPVGARPDEALLHAPVLDLRHRHGVAADLARTRDVRLKRAQVDGPILQMEAEVPFDPYDLPGYAARLVRLHERRPEIMRLCTWQRLERTDGEPNPVGVGYARAQIDAIAQAQKTGDLPAHFHPGFLLGLVLHLATGWVSVSPEFEAAIDVPAPEERARHVEDAIRTLLSQPAPA